MFKHATVTTSRTCAVASALPCVAEVRQLQPYRACGVALVAGAAGAAGAAAGAAGG